MSKIFSKTLKKTTLMSVLLAVVLAAAIVVGALFGFNKSVTMDDNATLTVTVNTFAYNNDKEEITKTCEKAFDTAKVSAEYVIEGEMNGDSCELVFVFDKKVDTAALKDSVKTALTAGFASASINVSASKEVAQAVVAKHFLLRAAIAAAVFAVLAFAYVAVRYKSVWTGLAVGASVFLSMALTVGLLVLTRLPVTVSTASVVAVAGLLTAVSVLLTLGKVRSARKEDENESAEALLSSKVAAKETLTLGIGLTAAMLLVGILGKTTAAWYASAALIAIAVAVLISLFYAPALYLSVKRIEDGKSKSGYVGAKKSAKKTKAAVQAEGVEEAPAQESTEA